MFSQADLPEEDYVKERLKEAGLSDEEIALVLSELFRDTNSTS